MTQCQVQILKSHFLVALWGYPSRCNRFVMQ
jgi:hypothetical protein